MGVVWKNDIVITILGDVNVPTCSKSVSLKLMALKMWKIWLFFSLTQQRNRNKSKQMLPLTI